MFGNKYAGMEIANEMHKILNKAEPKPAIKSASLKAVAIVKPEDFLVSPELKDEDAGASIDNRISNMSSYSDDKDSTCKIHNVARDSCGCQSSDSDESISAGSMIAEDLADSSSSIEDISYLIDARAEVILGGLGKVAKSLIDKNEYFAADLVEATAIGIRNDYIKKAENKINVINSLKKMASSFYQEGNEIAGDMVTVTVNKIKKNS